VFSRAQDYTQINRLSSLNTDELTLETKGLSKYLIRQSNALKVIWDLFILLELIFISILVPYRIAYETSENHNWSIVYYFIDVCFGIDILLTFNTTYINQGSYNEITDRKEIILNYLQGWFCFDLLAIVPFDTFISSKAD